MTPTKTKGQRWHYKDSCQEFVVEMISPRDGYGWKAKVVQVIFSRGRSMGSVDTWIFGYGVWIYLEGQDSPQ